jgi:hypothetical protein
VAGVWNLGGLVSASVVDWCLVVVDVCPAEQRRNSGRVLLSVPAVRADGLLLSP